MNSDTLKTMRTRLGKTQKELAHLLGISIKAVHSYEQGWRRIPHHVERQLLFLMARIMNPGMADGKQCWEIRHCPSDRKKKCPAFEFSAGNLCWFVNGTHCSGEACHTWAEKMAACRQCDLFLTLFNPEKGGVPHEGFSDKH